MIPFKLIIITLALTVLNSCSGINENAAIPLAQTARPTFIDIGNYSIHFSAQLTNQLPLEVARKYKISQSKNTALLNIAVVENMTQIPVSANISVKATNLAGQRKNFTLRMLHDKEAIYYIGETSVANHETLIFDIEVIPEDTAENSQIRFESKFYID